MGPRKFEMGLGDVFILPTAIQATHGRCGTHLFERTVSSIYHQVNSELSDSSPRRAAIALYDRWTKTGEERATRGRQGTFRDILCGVVLSRIWNPMMTQ